MRLVTWNIGGLDDEAVDERTEAAVFTAILGVRLDQLHQGTKPKPPPDVIVLQEVVTRTLRAHIEPHFGAAGYTIVSSQSDRRSSFELIACRPPTELIDFRREPLHDSVYARELNLANLKTPDGEMRLLTAHFDGGTEAGVVRTAQLRQVAAAIGPRGVFAGDANLRKAEWEAVRDQLPMTDVWEALGGPNATRFTWRRGGHKARFDRVFVGTDLQASSLLAIGVGVVPGLGMPISDHLGLVAGIAPRTRGAFKPACAAG